MTNNVLTIKRCRILLVVACCIYFMLNIVVWHMALIVAIVGAICTTAAFGLFLWFIKIISRKKEQEAIWDAEHFERELLTAKEREKTNIELLNRLTRDCARLQERMENIKSLNQRLLTRNLELESRIGNFLNLSEEIECKSVKNGRKSND